MSVIAGPQIRIDRIDPRGLYANEHLPVTRRGGGRILELHNLGLTKFSYNDGFHTKKCRHDAGDRSLFNCYRFCQVTRLVNVAAAADGDVIREQLQRDDREDRSEQVRCLGYLDHMVRHL